MLYGIIGALAAGEICLLMYCIRLKRERNLLAGLREGYEKKYNAFRIKYTLLGRLEDKNAVIRRTSKIPQPFYLYGGGILGEKLLHILKEADIGVTRVLEGKELEQNPEYGRLLNTEQYVIVTPMQDYDRIVELLGRYFQKEKIIGLDEIIS